MSPGPAPKTTDENAFAAFLQQAEPRVRQLLRRLCAHPGDADDVLQETLTKVWRLRDRFDADRNGEAWLLQAAFHCFLDHRQRERRQPAPQEHVDPAATARPLDLELREEVNHRLAQLPPLERDLLLGFHGHGLSLKELALRHQLPINTVKSHLHRARLRLPKEPHDED